MMLSPKIHHEGKLKTAVNFPETGELFLLTGTDVERVTHLTVRRDK